MSSWVIALPAPELDLEQFGDRRLDLGIDRMGDLVVDELRRQHRQARDGVDEVAVMVHVVCDGHGVGSPVSGYPLSPTGCAGAMPSSGFAKARRCRPILGSSAPRNFRLFHEKGPQDFLLFRNPATRRPVYRGSQCPARDLPTRLLQNANRSSRVRVTIPAASSVALLARFL